MYAFHKVMQLCNLDKALIIQDNYTFMPLDQIQSLRIGIDHIQVIF